MYGKYDVSASRSYNLRISSFHDELRLYDYAFPQELIANAPANPRDSAKLLVFDRETKKTDWATFADIGKFLPSNSVLVLNQTKVIPARLRVTKQTGGTVDILSLGTTAMGMSVLSNKKLTIGEYLKLDDQRGFTVVSHEPKKWLLKPDFPVDQLQEILEQHGTMPLPPYIKDSPLSESELREQYQTVFAKNPGSIAAPTASLHFTEELLKSLQESGITLAYVTLHVHLGTFASLTEEQWETGILHVESYSIDPDAVRLLESSKKEGKKIVAVGTTALRTLESASDRNGKITAPEGTTTLFIREGYDFKMVDGLITNFHVPKSSLLMLVSAFAGRETILDLYRKAIEKKFKLFSFGDGMLIL